MKYEDDGFDPTPYDRILAGIHSPAVMLTEEARKKLETEAGQENVFRRPHEFEIIEMPEELANAPAGIIKPKKGPAAEDVKAEAPIDVPIDAPVDEAKAENAKAEEAGAPTQTEIAPDLVQPTAAVPEPETLSPESGNEQAAAEPAEKDAEFVEIPLYDRPIAKSPEPEAETKPQKRDGGKMIPVGAAALSETLKFADISEREPVRVYIEEDILVPDVKPDLQSIVSMNGNVSLKREDLIKINGEVTVNALYLPIASKGEPICFVTARVPFRTDLGGDISPMSTLTVNPEIESIEHKVINERKFRTKIALVLHIREYNDVEVSCFSGIRGEEVQLLKENVTVTEILSKKTEEMEISEILPLKEGMPRPLQILRSSISVAPNHKQISSEKAVINASVYCNVLYLAENPNAEEVEESTEKTKVPVLFQSKTEFTQFIPMEGTERQSGSKLSFDTRRLSIGIDEPTTETESGGGLRLSGTVETTLEIYKNSDREIVTDVYHAHKEMVCDSSPLEVKSFIGSGTADISAREIFNVPDRYEDVGNVLYADVRVKNSSLSAEQNKAYVSGTLDAEILCTGADERKSIFSLRKEIPFRGSMDVSGAKPEMLSDYRIDFKDIWFEKISGRQVELNAGMLVSALLWKRSISNLISNPHIVEREESEQGGPSVIVYVTTPNDTLWSIAKKFRTSIDDISEINQVEKNRPIKPGSKILIVK